MSVAVSVHLRNYISGDQRRPKFEPSVLEGSGIPYLTVTTPDNVAVDLFLDLQDIPAFQRALSELQNLAANAKEKQNALASGDDDEQPVVDSAGDHPAVVVLDADGVDAEISRRAGLQEGEERG